MVSRFCWGGIIEAVLFQIEQKKSITFTHRNYIIQRSTEEIDANYKIFGNSDSISCFFPVLTMLRTAVTGITPRTNSRNFSQIANH